MTPEQTAWVAGLLEGEGTFSTSGNHAEVLCAMTDRDVLERLQSIAGGNLSQPYMVERSTKPITRWTLGKRTEVEPLLRSIRPLMGQRRGQKIDEMLALIEERKAAHLARLKPCGTRAKYERGCRCRACTRARYYHNLNMKRRLVDIRGRP